jgi:hypothetical protein
MPYNPKIQTTQIIGIPYKKALIELAKHEKRGLQLQTEFLITQACLARGIRVNPPKPKEKG